MTIPPEQTNLNAAHVCVDGGIIGTREPGALRIINLRIMSVRLVRPQAACGGRSANT
jgi:hypothetical protein